jgi:hypothetical protein
MSRINVYYDGIQVDNLESRNGQVLDLSTIPLWSLDHVTITRDANNLRIDVQSWQYNSTTPYTRADVLTGDLSTDIYRAFYGKRFYNGASLQIAAQQLGTVDNRLGGGGDAFSFFGRYGIARRMWSIDATVNRSSTTRSIISVRGGAPGELLPDYRAQNTIAYLRAAIGRPGNGPFLQFVAANLGVRESSAHFNTAAAAQYGFPPDTVDSAASLSQYVATAGLDGGGFRLRLIDRYRTHGGGFNGGTASIGYAARVLSFNALAERDPYYGYTNLEVGGRFAPLPILAISGFIGERRTDSARTTQPDARSARVEAGVRLFGGTWLSAGVVSRDTALLVPPIVFDSAFRYSSAGRTTGTIFSLRGPIGYGFSVDAASTIWKDPTAYLSKDQTHVELKYFTEWLSRFPNRNFSFLLSSTLDYRNLVAFPDSSGATVPTVPFRYTALASYIYSVRAEIRILRGVITYQRRNLDLLIYDQVPGFIMPRGVNLYGVRWYFFD